MNTGRDAAASRRASESASAASGRTSPGAEIPGRGAGAGAGWAWTSSGRFSSTGRRCCSAVRKARTVSATALAAVCVRSDTAPTATPSASWSIRKLDSTAEPAESAVSTIIGVRLLAASVIPVIALVSPQPWCRLSTLTLPLIRE